jgi:hypothetical protein
VVVFPRKDRTPGHTNEQLGHEVGAALDAIRAPLNTVAMASLRPW